MATLTNESGAIRLMVMLFYLISALERYQPASANPYRSKQFTVATENEFETSDLEVVSVSNNTQPFSYPESSEQNSIAPNEQQPQRLSLATQAGDRLPEERTLNLHILINDPVDPKKQKDRQKYIIRHHEQASSSNRTQTASTDTLARRRQTDYFQDLEPLASGVGKTTGGNRVLDKYGPYERHFYALEPTKAVEQEDSFSLPKLPQVRTTKSPSNPGVRRHELISNQHGPPWIWRQSHPQSQLQFAEDNRHLPELIGKRYKLKITTVPPEMPTTEFFKLISSAHSPVRLVSHNSTIPVRLISSNHSARNRTTPEAHMIPVRVQISGANSSAGASITTTAIPALLSARLRPHKATALPVSDDGRVRSTAIVVNDDEGASQVDYQRKGEILVKSHSRRKSTTVQPSEMENTISVHQSTIRDPQGDTRAPSGDGRGGNEYLASLEGQFILEPSQASMNGNLDVKMGKRPLTIIKHSQGSRGTPTMLVVASNGNKTGELIPPSSISIQAESSDPSGSLPPPVASPSNIHINANDGDIGGSNGTSSLLAGSSQLVRLISKQKHKYDDNIVSPTLTVVDSQAIRTPPNATTVHNNKLFVAIRPGRPHRRYPQTTQFPVYNIVAGITPPYAPRPTPLPAHTRPPSIDGSVYGLLKPNGSDMSSPIPPASSNFGAQNIKFPAPSPSTTLVEGAEMPDRMNISVPDSASLVGPNKVPNRIVMDSGEQISRPPDAVVVSDSTIISRPYGSSTITNNDGIVKLSTTRRPFRVLTTKRINIVSANTTVVTTDPDQLHEVLSSVIAHHQQGPIHHSNHSKPNTGLFASIGKFFNAGMTTSIIAFLTLMKTIFVALLVMFLPPIALTTAIMQAVSLG